MGSNCAQLMFGSGWLALESNGASVTGKYWPRFWPFAAVTNGVENSGGAGLVYVVPYGAFALMTPIVRASIAV